jgi:hypothetical protein
MVTSFLWEKRKSQTFVLTFRGNLLPLLPFLVERPESKH